MTTFLQLQNNVTGNRFDASQLAAVKRWINRKYVEIWNMEDQWLFRLAGPTNVTVTAGSQTVTALPADLADVLAVYNDKGESLEKLSPVDYDNIVLPDVANAARAKPTVYKVVNRVLYVGSPSDANYTFQIDYTRRVSYYTATPTLTQGLMAADTDYPAWDAEHHDVLELGATALGLRMENDSTAELVEDSYQQALAAMREALVAEDSGLVYGGS